MLIMTLIMVVLIVFIWAYHFMYGAKKQNIMYPCILSFIIILSTAGLYFQVGHPQALTEIANQGKAKEAPTRIIESAQGKNQSMIEEMQQRVVEDKQDGKRWYALGNAYMYANQFENAATAFLYAERLASEPQANIYAARATALYYQNNQRFDDEIRSLIDKALIIDAHNVPSLMLVASNHFLSAEYQDAIDTWQIALDSEHDDVDRVALIKAINQAKALL